MSGADPWDEVPDAFASEDEDKVEDPDEILAQLVQRSRHGGGTHIFGSWRGIWHGLRAGNAALRREAELAVLADKVQTVVAEALGAVRGGKLEAARTALERAVQILGERSAVATAAPTRSKK